MVWRREYFGIASKRRTAYVSGAYRIVKTQSKNIWTGQIMSDQVWEVFFNGIKICFADTLKQAKEMAEKFQEKGGM